MMTVDLVGLVATKMCRNVTRGGTVGVGKLGLTEIWISHQSHQTRTDKTNHLDDALQDEGPLGRAL